jgi:hypothetical protein
MLSVGHGQQRRGHAIAAAFSTRTAIFEACGDAGRAARDIPVTLRSVVMRPRNR